MSDRQPNLTVTANVMLVINPATGRERSIYEQAAFVPGDFAAKVYRSAWPVIREQLTPAQLMEYEEYLPCLGCGLIAGQCDCKAP
jgi:hypothetical protein